MLDTILSRLAHRERQVSGKSGEFHVGADEELPLVALFDTLIEFGASPRNVRVTVSVG